MSDTLKRRLAVEVIARRLADYDPDWAQVKAETHAKDVRVDDDGNVDAAALANVIRTVTGDRAAAKFKKDSGPFGVVLDPALRQGISDAQREVADVQRRARRGMRRGGGGIREAKRRLRGQRTRDDE